MAKKSEPTGFVAFEIDINERGEVSKIHLGYYHNQVKLVGNLNNHYAYLVSNGKDIWTTPYQQGYKCTRGKIARMLVADLLGGVKC